MRWTTLVIVALLAVVQGNLWFGKVNLPYTMSLRRDLAEQRAINDKARERNARITAELADLREGLEMVEERARAELGMIKPNEILVQVSASK